MAVEKIVSPGVFTKEVDQSVLPTAVAGIGAAIIGPTSRGPAGVPTVVTSYSEFEQKFGGAFLSGSGVTRDSYKYLTNYAAQEYLKYADTLTVIRVLAGEYSHASSSVLYNTGQDIDGAYSTGSFDLSNLAYKQAIKFTDGSDTYTFVAVQPDSPLLFADNTTTDTYYYATGSDSAGTVANLVTEINGSDLSSLLTATADTTTLIVSGANIGITGNGITAQTSSQATPQTFESPAILTVGGGINQVSTFEPAFVLHTLSDGADQNSYTATEGTNNTLANGTNNNVRWEVTSRNTSRGTFDLQIRQGDDTSRTKNILESYSNLTLDPNSPNYIAKRIGDQSFTLQGSNTATPYVQTNGDYPNKSRYVRVEVLRKTIDYLDENGTVRVPANSGSIPVLGSGSFQGGSDGNVTHPRQMYQNIANANVQGLNPTSNNDGKIAYNDAINVLKNADEYDFNLLGLPGLVRSHADHGTLIETALTVVEDRGDAFLIIDPHAYGATTLQEVTTQSDQLRSTNYAAMYWPWVKVADTQLGKNVWVPAGVLIPGVYAFNDRVAAPWFAPAGLNRGGMDAAVSVERKLTQSNRDTLYEANINPIASFPNTGIVVYGQKTLQKKASALDRVNVRRLLIAAKKFVASASKFLVFEQNTTVTRNRFLSIVNPYFDNVQQRQGLYAFKVVMDESLNTPDVIDRNQLVGQIYLQPTRTAEFILIDFNILPTGAAFPE